MEDLCFMDTSDKLNIRDSFEIFCQNELKERSQKLMHIKHEKLKEEERRKQLKQLISMNLLVQNCAEMQAKLEEEERKREFELSECLKNERLMLEDSLDVHFKDFNQKQQKILQKKNEIDREKSNSNLKEITEKKKEIFQINKQIENFSLICAQNQKLNGFLSNSQLIMRQILDKIEKVVSQGNFSDEDLQKIFTLTSFSKDLIKNLTTIIEEELKIEKEKILLDQQKTLPPSEKYFGAKSDLPQSMASTCQNLYSDLLQFSCQVENLCEQFISNQEQKKYRFKLMKAVGEIINTLNSHDPHNILDRILKTNMLLKGEEFIISNNQKVSLRDHPQARVFCLKRLAQKIVDQASESVSSKPDTAFMYSSLAKGIWKEEPLFGKHLLSQFATKCPSTVPFLMQKGETSQVDYFQMLGFMVEDNGELEKKNKFLKRLSGYITLYAALMTSDSFRGPLSTADAWKWMARFVSQDPLPGISATCLYQFFVVIGNEMSRNYKGQFMKALHFIWKQYLPRVAKVTGEEEQAPLARLGLFLEESLERGFIPQLKNS